MSFIPLSVACPQMDSNVHFLTVNLDILAYSKTCLKGLLKTNTYKLAFNNNYCLMQVKSIAECSPWSILHTFDLHQAIIFH